MLLVLTNCFVILLLLRSNYCSMLVFAFVVSVNFLKVTDLASFRYNVSYNMFHIIFHHCVKGSPDTIQSSKQCLFPFEGKEFRGFVTNIDVSCYWCITCDCIVCLKISF